MDFPKPPHRRDRQNAKAKCNEPGDLLHDARPGRKFADAKDHLEDRHHRKKCRHCSPPFHSLDCDPGMDADSILPPEPQPSQGGNGASKTLSRERPCQRPEINPARPALEGAPGAAGHVCWAPVQWPVRWRLRGRRDRRRSASDAAPRRPSDAAGRSSHVPGWRTSGCAGSRQLRRISGGAKGSRTPDLLNAIQALSQLSYGPGRAEGGI